MNDERTLTQLNSNTPLNPFKSPLWVSLLDMYLECCEEPNYVPSISNRPHFYLLSHHYLLSISVGRTNNSAMITNNLNSNNDQVSCCPLQEKHKQKVNTGLPNRYSLEKRTGDREKCVPVCVC